MTETDWGILIEYTVFFNREFEFVDLVMKVHLKGAFAVTKAAWPYMRDQKYGRLVFTSSNSGLYGSFGQANYAAAKMGLVGLSSTLAIEGQKYNINSNALVCSANGKQGVILILMAFA
jgi:NAD(P)-dependent dehydrogenase (short-subunit alcohol dehydrogenase family)